MGLPPNLITGRTTQLPGDWKRQPGGRASRGRGMNRWEKQWDGELACRKAMGAVVWYAYETVKLRVAGAKACWYTPDFCALTADGKVVFYEVKGFMRDDAAVKLKVCVAAYPHFQFCLVRRKGGEWTETWL